jgi:hypothetical protein
MSSYFYCYSLPLGVGSVIDPGNWGRILRTYSQQSGNAWTLVRELVYELIRREHFPTKPSRFDCLFLCTSEAGLSEFRNRTGRRLDIGYEVELVDPQAVSHAGDWTLPNLQASNDVPSLEKRALQYWQGHNIVQPELATLSPIRIVQRLT